MAVRFRIYHVANDDQTLREKIIFEIPNCSVNIPPSSRIDESNAIVTYDAMANWVINHSNGKISGMTNMLLWMNNDNNSHTLLLKAKGLTTVFDSLNNMAVGDKIYINKWDHSHSYMLYKAKQGDQFIFDYCCPDGTVAYSNVGWTQPLDFGGYGFQYTIPWLYYWGETNNNYYITEFTLGVYDTYNCFLDCTIGSGHGPTSVANAKAFWADAPILDINPYEEGGYSTSGGGNPQKQNWSEDSDFVKEDAMPDEEFYGAIATGLVTLFHPSKDQLRRLASVLWADNFWNFVQNAIQNIGDLFISLGMVPFSITGGNDVEVTWFNYAVTGAASKTDIYLKLCENQFIEFDMGSIALDGTDNRIFATDSVLDYSPYSKLGIFLPFIGYQELDIDECRGQILYLKYRVDILSGTCVALISLRPVSEDPVNSRTIYQFTGNCLTQLPLTAVDAQTVITNAVNLGISLVGVGTAGAVASAGDAVTAELQTREHNPISSAQADLRTKQAMASVASAGGSLASASVNAVMGMKPDFKHSGAIGASSSLLSVKQPYLFLTTPRQSMPEGYNKVCGFPCNIYGNIGDFEGFTVVEDVRLNGLVATSPEVEEIYHLLKNGIII